MHTISHTIPTGKVLGSSATAALGLLFALTVSAQDPGEVHDWTHDHLVFSNPGTLEEAAQNGTYEQWIGIVNDPRFRLQQRRRSAVRPDAVAGLPEAAEAPEATTEMPETTERISNGPLRRGLSRAPSVPWRGGPAPLPRRTRSVHTDWSENLGSGASAGLGVSPAKYSFSTTGANCATDFVVYNTGLAGATTVASIVAYSNLYTACGGAVPSVYWAFNTGGTVGTSVVFSPDGTQVAFAQTVAGAASMVVLKWKAASGTPTAPVAPSAVAASKYRTCTAPCMTTLAFSGGANDSGSSPYYDYSGSDALYVGDDGGKLHKFAGIFQGTPAESASPWPAAVSTSALSSPVYDSTSGRIFVGDYLLNTSSTCAEPGTPCGTLRAVSATTGVTTGTSGRLDAIFGLVDAPVVDSAAGMVYAFVGSDGNTAAGSACGAHVPCSAVFQLPTSFTSGTGKETTLGAGYQFLLAGTFDNAYYASSGLPTGHLYAVGNTGPGNNTLYQVPINANVMGAATAGPVLANNYTNGLDAAGLEVGEFYNGSKDYIFVSVLSYGLPANCNGSEANGCVMGFDVTSGSLAPSATPTAATAEAGGTSGIIIDNAATSAGASNIYFTPLANQTCTTSGGTGGCAIQAAQAAP
jgi:hypothetical protein